MAGMTFTQWLKMLIDKLVLNRVPIIEVVDDPEFWAMIAERRKQPCLTSEELKRKMGLVP